MSKTAARFSDKKPIISAQVEITEHFQAMEAERADHLAMLADIDLDYSGRFQTEYFFAEHDPRFERWCASRRSTNALFLDMIYDEESERQEREEDKYDQQCENAAADRYEFGYDRY